MQVSIYSISRTEKLLSGFLLAACKVKHLNIAEASYLRGRSVDLFFSFQIGRSLLQLYWFIVEEILSA